MKLYEIDNEIMRIESNIVDEETGEINTEMYDQLKSLKMEKSEKVKNIALLYKNLMSDAEQLKAERLKFANRENKVLKKAEWFKAYLFVSLCGEKFDSTEVTISYRKSKAVECTLDDITKLPSQFVRYGEPELNKTEVRKFIEQGGHLDGCYITDNISIQIK